MEYRYTAIVLKKREVGETDRIYTFFTREAGKVASIAKGVRKSEAKLASALETGSKVEVMLVRTRGMGRVAGAVLEESYPPLRQNFEALRRIVETLTTVDRLVELDEKDEALYQLLENYLGIMSLLSSTGREDKLGLVTEAFYFQLFFHLGYPLQLGVSVVSGMKLSPGKRYILSASEGGVLDQSEGSQVKDGMLVSEDTIKLLRLFGQHSLAELCKVGGSEVAMVELSQFRAIFLSRIRR